MHLVHIVHRNKICLVCFSYICPCKRRLLSLWIFLVYQIKLLFSHMSIGHCPCKEYFSTLELRIFSVLVISNVSMWRILYYFSMLFIMNIVLVLFKCVLVRGTLVWSKLVRNPAYSIHPFTLSLCCIHPNQI